MDSSVHIVEKSVQIMDTYINIYNYRDNHSDKSLYTKRKKTTGEI
jgi:hypothetical protein